MDQYTQMLVRMSDSLAPDDDCYEEKLLSIAGTFRGFGAALTAFLCEYGFTGNPDDADEKASYLREKFRMAGIAPNRNIREWFTSGREIRRDSPTPFQICFALGLDVDETNDFFRRVCFERGFDCHNISEAVYYFCIRNGLPFSEAVEIIGQIPKPNAAAKTPDYEVLYTGTIIDFINGISSKDVLISYISDHIDEFGYNNATATKHIQALWEAITCQDGIAHKEGLLLDRAFHIITSDPPDREDEYTIACKDSGSVWKVLSQIVGLDRKQTAQLSSGRNLKPLLENNSLLPALAERSFPDHTGITKILNGVHVSHELIRKNMILLEFYAYWASLTVEHKNALWESTEIDAERCMDKINRYLIEAGYPELYPGNPYDWIFMWAVKDSRPLLTFRDHMRTIYANKSHETSGTGT